MQLETILCEFGQICATGNALRQLLKQFYASLDKSLQHEMLTYSWKRFYASLDESVLQGIRNSTLVVKRFKISDTCKFGTDSRTGIAFLGSKFSGILYLSHVPNYIPKSLELSRLPHSKLDDLMPTQPFHGYF